MAKKRTASSTGHPAAIGVAIGLLIGIVGGLVWGAWQQESTDDMPTTAVMNTTKNSNTSSQATATNTNKNTVSNVNTNTNTGSLPEALPFSIPEIASDYTTAGTADAPVWTFGEGNVITRVAAADAGIVTGSLGDVTTTDLTVGGYNAQRTTGSSPRDGSTMTYLLITVNDQVYVVRGDDAFLQSVQDHFEIVTSEE